MAINRGQSFDPFIVADVRNGLFNEGQDVPNNVFTPGLDGLDLFAMNLERARDHGIPGMLQIAPCIL